MCVSSLSRLGIRKWRCSEVWTIGFDHTKGVPCTLDSSKHTCEEHSGQDGVRGMMPEAGGSVGRATSAIVACSNEGAA